MFTLGHESSPRSRQVCTFLLCGLNSDGLLLKQLSNYGEGLLTDKKHEEEKKIFFFLASKSFRLAELEETLQAKFFK